MGFYDLKFFPGFSRPPSLRISVKEAGREPRTNRVGSNHAVSFSRRIPSLRPALRWKPKHSAILLLGSVSRDGFRPAHVSREPSRHRGLSGSSQEQPLSLRTQRTSETLHLGRCQRAPRLENLRRLRAHSYRYCSTAVRRHRPGTGLGCHGLRAGRHDHRSPASRCFLGQDSERPKALSSFTQ